MGKFVVTDYNNTKEILKYPDHHVSTTVTVDATGVTANGEGKKIVPAGTIVGGGFLADRSVKAKASSETVAAEGVLRYDVDVTHGPAVAAVVLHGFVDLTKLPAQPTAAQITALKQITFLK
ncbi:hypothetical protein [Lysinibacillus sp. SGAir0095]|uniref:hypothetical protein n=1 Tax=Lysinibacillus sp. SGAir0095 TaxID=2070463 RepID=UPI0010CD47B2|nr:hypothetical protein [Lysinibacillus sp. SGAir0095]QCR33132.1 hypothetical protein C1N55_13490 [Lysinibacillus sp. SGAir0095]